DRADRAKESGVVPHQSSQPDLSINLFADRPELVVARAQDPRYPFAPLLFPNRTEDEVVHDLRRRLQELGPGLARENAEHGRAERVIAKPPEEVEGPQ